MNLRLSPRWLVPVVVVWLVWVGACAPTAAPSSTAAPPPAAAKSEAQPAAVQAPQQKTDVSLRLPWFARGYDAPYYLALRGSVDDLEWSDDRFLRVTFNLPAGEDELTSR